MMEHCFEKVIFMGHTTVATHTSAIPQLGRSDVQDERFQSATRLVLDPTGGGFEPAIDLGPGRRIQVGRVVEHLSSGSNRTPIVSPFADQAGEGLTWWGECLVSYQPVMWLSTNGGAP